MGDFERRSAEEAREAKAKKLRDQQEAAQRQSIEYLAGAEFAEAFDKLSKTPAVDAMLEERKANYETKLLALIKAAKNNGREA